MRRFLSVPMELRLQRWAGIYPHNQMHLQFIPSPLSAANNRHPSTPAHQHQRVVIKTRPTSIPTLHPFLYPLSSPFLPIFSRYFHIFCSIFTRRNGYILFYHSLTEAEVGELALGYAACNVASLFPSTPCSLRDAQRLDVVSYCVADPPTATLLI
jgi:hypothetical protein